MPAPITKAHAAKLLTAAEMKLYEESRVHTLRALSASQIDRRILRMRDLRDRARDLLQRQRVAMRERTGSKRGETGEAVQQRSKDKIALLSNMLKRFEGQLKIARKAEAAGQPPKNAPKRHATRKAAKTRTTAPGKDFTAARMRSRRKDADEAADTMRARKNPATSASVDDLPMPRATANKKVAAKKAAAKKAPARKSVTKKAVTEKSASRKTASKKVSAKKAPAKKPAATQPAAPVATHAPVNALPGGETGGKRTANLKALNASGGSALHKGYADVRARNIALEQKLEAGRKTPIQGHVSSRGRRNQGKRDGRG